MKFVMQTQGKDEAAVEMDDPSPEELSRAWQDADWGNYVSAKLEIDRKNYLEAFGEEEFGITVAYCESGVRRMSPSPDLNSADALSIFLQYLQKDDDWRFGADWRVAPDQTDAEDVPLCGTQPGACGGDISFFRFFLSILGLVAGIFFHWVPSLFTGRIRCGSVVMVKDDDAEMQRAIDEAKENMPVFFAAFEDRSGKYSGFALKQQIVDENGSEHVWLTDIEKETNTWCGVIANQPHRVECVEAGQKIALDLSKVTDWGFWQGDDPKGFYTSRALHENLSRKEKKTVGKLFRK